jgi:hypothetical protein
MAKRQSKSVTAQAKRLQSTLRAIRAKARTRIGSVDSAKKALSEIDQLSEMGEMESLRLQMAMDRMAKMMSTLSNLLKKISDTAQSITQNLK